jgi:hypothetical protein
MVVLLRRFRNDSGLGRSSELGFENPLSFFGLLPTGSETGPPKVRHTFGFGDDGYWPQEKRLPFFRLLTRFSAVRTTHNRVVASVCHGWHTLFLTFTGFL